MSDLNKQRKWQQPMTTVLTQCSITTKKASFDLTAYDTTTGQKTKLRKGQQIFWVFKMRILAIFLMCLGAVCAAKDLGEELTKRSREISCKDFRCQGKYENCEMVLGSPVCMKKCPECSVTAKVDPVCGSDENTYASLCRLQQAECMEGILIEPLCKGKCPCDPSEVESMDPKTVHKLQKLRLEVLLNRRFTDEMKRETDAEEALKTLKSKKEEKLDVVTKEELDRMHFDKMAKWQQKKLLNLIEKNKQKADAKAQQTKHQLDKNACSKQELNDLPARLLDWFHILRSNNIRAKDATNKKSTLKEMSFLDAKLKAMYVSLACKQDPNRPDNEVYCLQPVQWMFEYLDTNKDNILQDTELADIENVNSEHCMKKFFLSCDRNMNGTVEKTEFCRCLCVEPPCTKEIENVPTLLISGVPRPVPGLFTPKCDEDGFFVSKQCTDKECFCVDRNGAEVKGTRVVGDNLKCADNTKRNQMEPVEEKKAQKSEEYIADSMPEEILP